MSKKDARLIRNIAWFVGGENLEDDVSNDEYAIRIIKMVRDHDKRLKKHELDSAECLACGHVFNNLHCPYCNSRSS